MVRPNRLSQATRRVQHTNESCIMDEITEASNKSLNPSAWVDEYGDYLYRYAVSRLRDVDAAEEVVQESFVAALRHVDQYEAKGTERAWLLGILKRKIIDLIRARGRTAPLSDAETNDPSEALFDRNGSWRSEVRRAAYAPLDSLEREEFWRILRGCLETLPPRQADVFVLREMDDHNTDEICKELEITPSNLWVILYRARLQLSKCMKSRWQQDRG
jgi:RNA polymerase sigma-70 factor (ECF subfamily)